MKHLNFHNDYSFEKLDKCLYSMFKLLNTITEINFEVRPVIIEMKVAQGFCDLENIASKTEFQKLAKTCLNLKE